MPSRNPPPTVEQVQEVFGLMANEGLSLRKSCVKLGLDKSGVLKVIDNGGAELQNQYARARDAMHDLLAEELEEIGLKAANAETAVQVNGLRLLADNRKWLLSKLAHRKYGDKLQLGGASDLPPIGMARTLTDAELTAIAAKQDAQQ